MIRKTHSLESCYNRIVAGCVQIAEDEKGVRQQICIGEKCRTKFAILLLRKLHGKGHFWPLISAQYTASSAPQYYSGMAALAATFRDTCEEGLGNNIYPSSMQNLTRRNSSFTYVISQPKSHWQLPFLYGKMPSL